LTIYWWREQRLGRGIQDEIDAHIDDQQSIVTALLTEKERRTKASSLSTAPRREIGRLPQTKHRRRYSFIQVIT